MAATIKTALATSTLAGGGGGGGTSDATAAHQQTQITAEQGTRTAAEGTRTAAEGLKTWSDNGGRVSPVVGQTGVDAGAGAVSAKTQRVVLATDQPLPAGPNVIGEVIVDFEGIPGALLDHNANQSATVVDFIRVTATGVVFDEERLVKNIKVLVAGTAGSLVAYNGTGAISGQEITPTYAYNEADVGKGKTIQFADGAVQRVQGLYLVVPTGAVLLVNVI